MADVLILIGHARAPTVGMGLLLFLLLVQVLRPRVGGTKGPSQVLVRTRKTADAGTGCAKVRHGLPQLTIAWFRRAAWRVRCLHASATAGDDRGPRGRLLPALPGDRGPVRLHGLCAPAVCLRFLPAVLATCLRAIVSLTSAGAAVSGTTR